MACISDYTGEQNNCDTQHDDEENPVELGPELDDLWRALNAQLSSILRRVDYVAAVVIGAKVALAAADLHRAIAKGLAALAPRLRALLFAKIAFGVRIMRARALTPGLLHLALEQLLFCFADAMTRHRLRARLIISEVSVAGRGRILLL